MNTTTKAKGKGETLRQWMLSLIVLVAGVIFTLGSGTAAAAPAAGTVIGNQATATYNDAGGTPRTATSNQVQTTVSQVKAFSLTASGTRTAAPGQTVYYPHTITNQGNGTDTYALVAPTSGTFAGASAGHGSLAYYIDANGDGLPDNATAITTTGPVTAGAVFRFVVAGTVPAAAANGDSASITVSATDTNTPTANSQSNTDTTTVAASVIGVNKSLSAISGPAGVTITVTLSYNNTGTAAATNLTITDPLPAGMNYVAGSGTWNTVAVTDATGAGDPAGIDYSVTGSTVTAIVSNVPAGFSGNVKFNVQIPTGRAPGFINNVASYTTTTQTSQSTNTASYQVLQTAAVIANGSQTSAVQGASEPITVASASPGSTITFNNVIWNKGNAADSFVITMNTATAAAWPAGTTFTLYQTDGVTSLIGNTTPSIPVTSGACPAGFVTDSSAPPNGPYCGYVVVLKVQLPAGATATASAMEVTKTATSTFDNTKTDTVIDRLSAISANTVDITNNAASGGSALGVGPGTATALVTNTVTPSPTGAVAVAPFRVYVSNTGAVNDNFNLAASNVPAGWSVTFYNDGGAANCSTLGASTTTTGNLNAGTNKLVCAVVTVPSAVSGQANPGTSSITFTTTSSTNGAVTDYLVDAVTVLAVHNVTLTPPGTQQTFPGGTVTYTHVVTNNGNVSETLSWNAITDSRSAQGWTSVGYVDANGNGSFDPGTDDVAAQLIPGGSNASFTLASGATRTIFVRVFASSSATGADPANLTTITVLYNAGASNASVTDSTSVTDGLVLTKTQGTVNCVGGAQVLAQTTGSLPAQLPGTCLKYQITGQNTTAANITAVFINDNVPGNTAVLTTACATTTTVGTIVTPTPSGFTGTVSANVGTLTPGQSAVLTFCVQIAP